MSFISNALAIAGFIILTVIIMWGVVHIASLSGFSLGSWFASSAKVEVTAPKNATSSQPITVSWKTTPPTAGTFSFLYQCEKNFEFRTQGQNGAVSKVPCAVAINVGSSTAASIMPIVSGTDGVSVPISVVFTPTASGTRAQGGATIIVAPAAPAMAPAPQPATIKTTVKPARLPGQGPGKPSTYTTTHASAKLVAHAASGPADLSVRIIAVGVIDPASGALINRAPTSPYDVVGVEFDIANVGGSATTPYYFQALLPIPAPNTYTSVAQISLKPGEHIVNTLRFSQAIRGGTFTVIVDPIGQVVESVKTNNQTAVVI